MNCFIFRFRYVTRRRSTIDVPSSAANPFIWPIEDLKPSPEPPANGGGGGTIGPALAGVPCWGKTDEPSRSNAPQKNLMRASGNQWNQDAQFLSLATMALSVAQTRYETRCLMRILKSNSPFRETKSRFYDSYEANDAINLILSDYGEFRTHINNVAFRGRNGPYAANIRLI